MNRFVKNVTIRWLGSKINENIVIFNIYIYILGCKFKIEISI